MGLDLRILPAYSVGSDFSIDVFSITRDTDLFEQIALVEATSGREVGKKAITSLLGSSGTRAYAYGYTYKHGHGIIKSVRIKELKNQLKGYKTTDYKNRMFLFFVRNAPLELELWLYWK